MKSNGDVELVLNAKATLGEGPSWDNRKQVLYWVDIQEKKVFIYNPITNENKVIQLDQYVGAVVPRENGEIVVALENGFYFLNTDTKELTLINDPESSIPTNRFNDGKCDSLGRFWAGTMNKGEPTRSGSLYCLDTNLIIHKKIAEVSISNGLAWSPDNHYFYYIDSPTKKVMRYNFDLQTGNLTNPLEVISYENYKGVPDGMTIDEEGMLWICHWGGSNVTRWNPHTGKRLDVIEVPAINVTSCTFGGNDMNELYITTARTDTTEEQLEKFPYAGGLFKIQTEVKGIPSYPFKG